MADQPKTEREAAEPKSPPPRHEPMTGDIPEEWRGGRYVTLTVGGGVDLAETHPTEANPEARG